MRGAQGVRARLRAKDLLNAGKLAAVSFKPLADDLIVVLADLVDRINDFGCSRSPLVETEQILLVVVISSSVDRQVVRRKVRTDVASDGGAKAIRPVYPTEVLARDRQQPAVTDNVELQLLPATRLGTHQFPLRLDTIRISLIRNKTLPTILFPGKEVLFVSASGLVRIRSDRAPCDNREVPLFRLTEYARAEAQFIHDAVDALSRSRGGLVAALPREATTRVGTTQVTTEQGATVELGPLEISSDMKMDVDDIVASRFGSLLASLDAAAERHHEQLSKYFVSTLETVTEATGNTIDGAGKSFFESIYEMFDKIELTFEPDGSISKGYMFVVHPDTVEVLKRQEAEMTADERRQLDELIDRKRQEYFARRRSRRLS